MDYSAQTVKTHDLAGGPADVAAASGSLAPLLSELGRHRLRVSLRRRGSQLMAAGVTARVALGSLATSGSDIAGAAAACRPAPDRGLSIIYSALRAGIPVTVTIIDPAGRAAEDCLAEFRHRFCEFLESASVNRRLLGLCLAAAELPSPEFRRLMRPNLGAGPRYVMLHDRAGSDLWRFLRLEEHGRPRFWPAFPSGVRSQCPLLSG